MKCTWSVAAKLTALVLMALGLCGCEAIAYYSQAVRGHFALYKKRTPLAEASADSRLNETERQRLAAIPDILAFAQKELHLPAEDQYQTLVFLERATVTWNVFAAPPDSLEPKTWCFILVGCLSYRGYFSESSARDYATQLDADGWETYVGGASAYSTLGWFNDPILSSFLKQNTLDLAGLLFHELAHQQLYIPNDTTFNESFATAVEISGVALWRTAHGASVETTEDRYALQLRLRDEFLALAMKTRADLKHVYDQALDPETTQAQRQHILDDFRAAYENNVKTRWNGHRPYAGWMKGPLNNAQWNTLGAYYDKVPAFRALLNATGQDFSKFYALCKKLGKLEKAERDEQLNQCTPDHCPLTTL